MRLLSIGELARATGVPTTTLRYYDDLGLVRPADRQAGRRRYDPAAKWMVGTVCVLRDVGFTLTEIAQLLESAPTRSRWDTLVAAKLTQLEAQAERIRIARTALEHAQRCPADSTLECPRFRKIVRGYLEGIPLQDSHRSLHPPAGD
jgi:DNA-binding transcriptional MerR regulator